MATAIDTFASRDDSPQEDHFVHLRGVSWEDYERILEVRGDHCAPRIQYLEGTLEIRSPSRDHEGIKSRIGRLVEVYLQFAGIEFEPVGSWTLKGRREERGVEPDECYILGDGDADRPHLVIEVIWTHGGIDKLKICRKLGVGEVWIWRKGVIHVFVLGDEAYVEAPQSRCLPNIDLGQLASFLGMKASRGMRAYRDALAAT